MMSVPAELDPLDCPLPGIHLIEASAGTGKTWNICALVLRLLLEGELDISRILVVTFTNAAMAELRERVRGRIGEVLAGLAPDASAGGDPFVPALIAATERRGVALETMRQRLDAALQNFDEAAIFTIHAFCQRALADAPFASGAPFDLELVTDDADLREEVVNDFWRRHVAGEDLAPAFAAYLLANQDSPERWSELLAQHLAKPLARTIWPRAAHAEPQDPMPLRLAFEAAREEWTAHRDAIVNLVFESLPRLNGNRYREASLERAVVGWDSWMRSADVQSALDPDIKLDLLCQRNLTVPASKAKQGLPPVHRFFALAEALLDARAALVRVLSLARQAMLRRLFEEGARELRQRKRDRRIVGYDDLLWNLHAALGSDDGPRLADALRERFPAALIDEFQDTDPLQFGIFDAIWGTGAQSLFLVGDPKQAIYSFRNADVHAYLRARDKARNRYTLTHNQRSTPALIAALNAIFGANPRAFILDELGYLSAQPGARIPALLADTSLPRAALELWMLPRDAAGIPLERTPALDAASAATAAEIARLLRESALGTIAVDGKPLLPEHIAVLVRTHHEGRLVRRALAALGVGSVELAQASVFHAPEAADFERLLSALLEPARMDLLRAALATEILGMDAPAIDVASTDDRELSALAIRFAGYRDAWVNRGFGVMFRGLLAAEAVVARLLTRPDGERHLTNLLHLGELAQSASAEHTSPDALLRWLELRRRERRDDDEKLLRLESDRNLVRIVTIHKAKGLEFDVVFCPLLWDAQARRGGTRRESREYHDAQGDAVVDFRSDDEIDAEDGAAARIAIDSRIRLERAAEALRLVYVALTRARSRCYVIAGCYALTGKPTAVGSSVRSLLNWLVAGDESSPEDWLSDKKNKRDCNDIATAWERVVARAAGAIHQEPLPAARGVPVPPGADADAGLHAATPSSRIASVWRIGSFSGLTLGATSETAASDHDARLAAPLTGAGPPPPDIPADDILRFPRGRSAGDCLHAVFEKIDFADVATWSPAIDDALREHPQPLSPAAAPRAPAMIAGLLRDVLATPLPGGFTLGAVTRDRRLTELEFHLPAPHLDPARFDVALAALDFEQPRLNPRSLEGYLKGFIDLAFEHAGRYYVLDWKSNYLGYLRADYGPAPVARAMAHHGYHLQYLLYSIALQRLLRHRLPHFEHEQHFGGVLYLFVRGVRPAWTNPDGTPAGVYHVRPAAAALARLEALLGARKAVSA